MASEHALQELMEKRKKVMRDFAEYRKRRLEQMKERKRVFSEGTGTCIYMYVYSRRQRKDPHHYHSTVHNILRLRRSYTVIVGIVHHITAYYGASCEKTF